VLQHGSILTGPAHRALAGLLPVSDGADPGRLGDALREKTTDLGEILGRPIDAKELAGCIRRGFELEWGIAFIHEAHSYA
jgi:hypothetical protein